MAKNKIIELDYNENFNLHFFKKIGHPFKFENEKIKIWSNKTWGNTNIENKKILIIRMCDLAVLYAEHNSVTYITDNKEKFNHYLEKINDKNFGEDDEGYLISDWKEEFKEIIKKMSKFDIIIMNPPYGSLFLKIFNNIVNSKIGNKIITIGPYQWIVEPWKKDKLMETLNNEIKIINDCGYTVNDFEEKNIDEIFNIGEERPGGILTISTDNSNNFDIGNFYKNININTQKTFAKFKTLDSLSNHIETYDGTQKYFVPVRENAIMERWWTYRLINYLDIIIDNKVYSGHYKGKTILEAREANPHENGRTNDRKTVGINCSSLIEAQNLKELFNSKIYLYIVSLVKDVRKFPFEILPFFDCKNGVPSFKEICEKCELNITEDKVNKLMENR